MYSLNEMTLGLNNTFGNLVTVVLGKSLKEMVQ